MDKKTDRAREINEEDASGSKNVNGTRSKWDFKKLEGNREEGRGRNYG